MKRFLITILILIIFCCCGIGIKEAKATTIIYTGYGANITAPFCCYGGDVSFTIYHDGISNFIVNLIDYNSGMVVANLVNEIGYFYGTRYGSLSPGDYFLDVYADGSWQIDVNGNIY